MRPVARQDGLLSTQVGHELVVYDRQRHRAHCLNGTAAIVWRHCDGHNTVPELAGLLADHLKAPVSEDLVWMALVRLERAHLLEGKLSRPHALQNGSRRELLKKIGRAAAVAALVPTVTSVVAPTPALAISLTCVPDGGPCNPPALPCCSTDFACFNNMCVLD